MRAVISVATILFVALCCGSARAQTTTTCPGIPQLFYWNLIETPPAPNVTVSYNSDTKLFDFDVSATYLREDSTYVVDFAPFPYDDPERQIDSPNMCENRIAADYANVTFDEMWGAADNAEVAGALGGDYLAYPSTGGMWSAEAAACDTVEYAASLGFGELSGCTDHNDAYAVSRALVPGSNPPVYLYSGSLYTTVVQPISKASRAAGYRTYEFVNPFTYMVTINTDAIASIESEQDLIINVVSIGITADGNLQIVLQTITPNDSQGLTNPAVANGPAGNDLDFITAVGSPDLAQTQEWIIQSESVQDAYSGTFEFAFDLVTSGEDVLAIVTIDMTVADVVSADITIDNLLEIYRDNYEEESRYTFQVSEPFGSGDDVYVKSRPDVNEEDRDSFTNDIVNAWLCFSNSGTAPQWDPTNGQFGCSVDTVDIPFDNRVQLVKDGAAQTTGRQGLLDAMQAAVDAGFVYSSDAGFHFRAVAFTFADQDFYIHVESNTVPTDQSLPAKRSHAVLRRSTETTLTASDDVPTALLDAGVDADVGALQLTYIAPPAEETSAPGGNGGDSTTGSGGGGDGDGGDGDIPWVVVGTMIPLNLCCFIVVAALWRKKRADDEEEKHRMEALARGVEEV